MFRSTPPTVGGISVNVLPRKMRFQDPSECTCKSCGVKSAIPVRELLRLTASCPKCQASFGEVGLSMRALSDDAATFFDAVQIIMQVEDDLGIEIPDSTVEEIKPWEQLTIRDLIVVTDRCVPEPRAVKSTAEGAVASAIRTLFPSSPDPLSYDTPLQDALSPNREYGASYE
jgi:hypothetical protein